MGKKTRKESQAFRELAAALREGIDAMKAGKKLTRRVFIKIDSPASLRAQQISKLRKTMNVSQGVFADILNVSVKTVQAWEGGRYQPSGPALRLMQLAKKHSEIFIQAVAG